MSSAFALLRRDVALALAQGGGGGVGLAFFALTALLVPLGIGPEPETLARIAGGVLWIAALLSALLSLDRIFQADWEDGSLDQLMLAPMALEQVVLVKAVAHWLTSALPMVLIAPLLGLMLQLPVSTLPVLAGAMLLGTPALSLVGAVGAAITVGIRRGGLLLSVLVLPLYLPTLIFGARAVERALMALDPAPVLALLAAVSLLAAALSPFAAAAALRMNAR